MRESVTKITLLALGICGVMVAVLGTVMTLITAPFWMGLWVLGLSMFFGAIAWADTHGS